MNVILQYREKSKCLPSNSKFALLTSVLIHVGLAINWPSDNMYWTDKTRGVIMVSRIDGRFERTVISNLPQPYGLTVDPVHRLVHATTIALTAS